MQVLLKYIKSREKRILALICLPRREYTEEKFHELRVEIKKLHAILELINFYSPRFKMNKTYKPFRKLFHKAGIIREIQLEEAVLDYFLPENSLRKYRRSIQSQYVRNLEEFFALRRKQVTKLKRRFRNIKSHVPETNQENTLKYCEDLNNNITSLLVGGALQISQAHKLRKQLKTLGYTVKSTGQDLLNIRVSPGENISHQLGLWHDCQVIGRILQKIPETGKLTESELTDLKKLRLRIADAAEILFSRINASLSDSPFTNSKNPIAK